MQVCNLWLQVLGFGRYAFACIRVLELQPWKKALRGLAFFPLIVLEACSVECKLAIYGSKFVRYPFLCI
jgi:hypothetical protein